jgi:hypothetical protein
MWQMVFDLLLSRQSAGHPDPPTNYLEEKQIPFATYKLDAS